MSDDVRQYRGIQIFLTILIVLVLVAAAVGWAIGYDRIERKIRSVGSVVVQDRSYGEATFPNIEMNNLSDTQQKIVELTKQEFALQSPGTKFSEGQKEAWCANFVSWIMKEAGIPFKNPNSGSWRIPGTYTLKDYFVSEGKFRETSSGYKPKVGDIAIYQGSPIFGEHANIIIKNEDGVLTTVGGNENNRIRVYKNVEKEYAGLLGYGILNS